MSTRASTFKQFFKYDVAIVKPEHFVSSWTGDDGYGGETEEGESAMEDWEFYWGPDKMYDSQYMCAADYNGLELSYFAEDFIGAHGNTT